MPILQVFIKYIFHMYLEKQPGHKVSHVARDGNSKHMFFLNYWDMVKHTTGA